MSASTTYGPLSVGNKEINTELTIQAGSKVRIQASGTVDFGGAFLGMGQVIRDADGDDWSTPSDYPAPDLRKNSLICKVGGQWYQGGTDKSFVPTQSGELLLRSNDKDLADNSRGWEVRVTVTSAGT